MKDPCSPDSDFRERQLRNGDLKTTYLLCAAGYSMAFISFVVEVVSKWFANRKSKFYSYFYNLDLWFLNQIYFM